MKKQKILYKVLVFVLILIAYFIGMCFPIKNILPVIVENRPQITPYEQHSLVVNWVLAVLTFLTIIVALMKEEIFRFFRHPTISIMKNNSSALKESLADVEQNRKVSREYYYPIDIENTGNIEARNIDIIISKIKYFNTLSNNEVDVVIEKKHIRINDGESKLLLPPAMTCSAVLFSISKESTSQANVRNPSQDSYILKIGDSIIDTEYQKGELSILFQAYCDGGYKDSKTVKLKWDGEWKDRLTDISPSHLNIEEV